LLGHHPRLEKELRKKGQRALATVIEAHQTHYNETIGNAAIVSNTRILWKLVLRVEPDGEEPFEAKLDALFGQLSDPTVGGQYPVLYDPKDHGKVLIDHTEEGSRRFVYEKAKEHTDAAVARMRERGQDDMADRLQAVYDAGLTSNWSRNSGELRQQIAERKAQIAEIIGGQNVVIGGQPVPGGPAAGGAGNAAATADALTKLADLRDRGALTDEEFEAQKRKLLGQ
jgi:hypothetical protein